MRLGLNILCLMGLNIRGVSETEKRENGGGKMGFALFSAGPELIGTRPVYSGCIGAVYKGRENKSNYFGERVLTLRFPVRKYWQEGN